MRKTRGRPKAEWSVWLLVSKVLPIVVVGSSGAHGSRGMWQMPLTWGRPADREKMLASAEALLCLPGHTSQSFSPAFKMMVQAENQAKGNISDSNWNTHELKNSHSFNFIYFTPLNMLSGRKTVHHVCLRRTEGVVRLPGTEVTDSWNHHEGDGK